MISQGILPYEYQEERTEKCLTGLAGLPLYLDLVVASGFCKSIRRYIEVRGKQGWDDVQLILALVLLNLAGGESVEDLRILQADEGFCKILRKAETCGLRRKVRRALERRWRKKRKRTVPSPSAVFRYLAAFHDKGQQELRQKNKAFIPQANQHLRGLAKVNADLLGFVQSHNPIQTATLDIDACLVETNKKDALYSYKEFKAYQPLNVYWFEQDVLAYTEFRDGNVPAGYQIKRIFEEALEQLPEGVQRVRLRSDSAGYQHELLAYCESGEARRFGRIEFAISSDVTPEFKKAVAEIEEKDWKPVYRHENGSQIATERQCAEVCFVPNKISHSKNAPELRYIATREELKQMTLPGMEAQQQLPFQTLEMNTRSYKVFGIVTNIRDWTAEEIIPWLNARCGKSEQAHGTLKEDFAGGKLPSGDFGENAAWWWISLLSFNFNSLMKHLVLPISWATKKMKAIRFALINLPGRILRRSRKLILRLAHRHPSFTILIDARNKIAKLAFPLLT